MKPICAVMSEMTCLTIYLLQFKTNYQTEMLNVLNF